MSEEISIALVCLAVAAVVRLAITHDRIVFAPLENVVGDIAITGAFAGCFLLTLGVTSGVGVAGVVAAAVVIAAGLSLARRPGAVAP